MTHYNFKKDLESSDKTEKEISNWLRDLYGWKIVSRNFTRHYDILIRKGVAKRRIEIKEDYLTQRTGNVGIEFSCRGKPSGINVTEATHYIYKVYLENGKARYFVTDVETIKQMIRLELYTRIAVGGDKGSNTAMYLFPLDVYEQYSKEIFT